jgi:predicted acylesterase/phospholipase RssA
VAIACQGGGSHTAFTAGVLKRLLRERLLERYDIVGLSGTSGGAVLSGEFRAFNSRREEITVDMVLASAAIPTLFRAVQVGSGTYWDGLFSQNPPIRELLDARLDELWVIRINPSEREHEPRTVAEIADRRNELSGNLSLHQELRFVEKIDQLLEAVLVSRPRSPRAAPPAASSTSVASCASTSAAGSRST